MNEMICLIRRQKSKKVSNKKPIFCLGKIREKCSRTLAKHLLIFKFIQRGVLYASIGPELSHCLFVIFLLTSFEVIHHQE